MSRYLNNNTSKINNTSNYLNQQNYLLYFASQKRNKQPRITRIFQNYYMKANNDINESSNLRTNYHFNFNPNKNKRNNQYHYLNNQNEQNSNSNNNHNNNQYIPNIPNIQSKQIYNSTYNIKNNYIQKTAIAKLFQEAKYNKEQQLDSRPNIIRKQRYIRQSKLKINLQDLDQIPRQSIFKRQFSKKKQSEQLQSQQQQNFSNQKQSVSDGSCQIQSNYDEKQLNQQKSNHVLRQQSIGIMQNIQSNKHNFKIVKQPLKQTGKQKQKEMPIINNILNSNKTQSQSIPIFDKKQSLFPSGNINQLKPKESQKQKKQIKKQQNVSPQNVNLFQKNNTNTSNIQVINATTDQIKSTSGFNFQNLNLFNANNKPLNSATTKGDQSNKPMNIFSPNTGTTFKETQELSRDKNRSQSRKQRQKSLFSKKKPQISQAIKKNTTSLEDIKLSSAEYLEKVIQFGKNAKIECQIQTKLNNLGGSRSTLNDLWQFTKSYISTIKKNDEKQVNTFATRVWDVIINTLIKNTNIKQGAQRMPPQQKDSTKQVQKNSINCYILIINLFRVMGNQKIWLIVVGKTLALVDFIYKRKQPIKKFTELELLTNKYVTKEGQIAPKYISRLDFLTYFLFGLCSFDPIEVFTQVNQRTQQTNQNALQEIKNYNHKWSYREFFCLVDEIFSNNFQGYFKPIIYMNMYSSIYLQIRKNKQNSIFYPQFLGLYKILIEKSAQYMSKINQYPQLKALSQEDVQVDGKNGFQFDGDQFKTCITTVGKRLKQKETELKYNLGDYQIKSSIFYYFKKSQQQ